MTNPYRSPGAQAHEPEPPQFNAVVALVFYGACALVVIAVVGGTVAYAAALLWYA
jgi:hypothetical protein